MSFGGGGSGKSFPAESTRLSNPITFFRDRTGVYPNSTEIWWMYKRPVEIGSEEAPKYYLDVFDPAIRHQTYFGSSPAPKGYFILNAFHQDRLAALNASQLTVPGVSTSTSALPVVSSNGSRPSCLAFYAGRVFYSGVHANEFNTRVYFSQVLEGKKQAGLCYQQQDPTSEELHDLLPTDGGVITIPEAARIVYLTPVGRSLFVFATNGVWEISGSEGIGFTALDYSVNKVSSTPALSPLSFFTIEGLPVWANKSGIHGVTSTEQGAYVVQGMTEATIKTFFHKIPEENRPYIQGDYDDVAKKARFLYKSTPTPPGGMPYLYDRSLLLDVKAGSWAPESFSNDGKVSLLDVVTLHARSSYRTDELVLVGNEPVLVGTENVVVTTETLLETPVGSKYLLYVHNSPIHGSGWTFGDLKDETLRDFRSFDGVGFEVPAHFTTGWGILGGGNKQFQSNYVTLSLESIEDSSLYVYGKWDYASSNVTGRWNQKQKIFAYDPNYEHVSRKLKFRGSGEVLQIHVESDGDHPFSLNGWVIFATAETTV